MISLIHAIMGRESHNRDAVRNELHEIMDRKEVERKIEEELQTHDSVDKMLPILLGSEYEPDPVKRSINIANGLYDKRLGGYSLFRNYKKSVIALLKKLNLI